MIIKKMIEDLWQIYYATKFMKKFPYADSKNTSQTVIFNTVRGLEFPLHQELFLANALARMGNKVIILLDDGMFEHWDTVQKHDNTEVLQPYHLSVLKKMKYLIIRNAILRAYRHRNIKVCYYSELLCDDLSSVILTEDDKSQAESSVRRFFEDGKYDHLNDAHQNYYEKSIHNCRVSKRIGQCVYEKFRPSLFISSHGIYSTWGPCRIVMENYKIPIIIYGAHAYRPQQIILSDVIHQILSANNEWKKFQEEPYVTEYENLVEQYLKTRISHSAFDTKIYYGSIKHFKNHIILEDKQKKVYGLFPNIIWDGDVKERDTIFSGVLDWAIKTINAFRDNPNILVIRFHPAEATLWSKSKSLEQLLVGYIPDLLSLKNVYLISAHEEIDTYDFVKNNIDVGIIYDGVLAMELTYLGVPVISCAKTRYTGAGFSFEPNTLSEYYTMLVNATLLVDKFNAEKDIRLQKLYKYAYWYFYLAGYYMPIFDPDIPLKINYRKLAESEYKMDKEKLIRLYNGLCNGLNVSSEEKDKKSRLLK